MLSQMPQAELDRTLEGIAATDAKLAAEIKALMYTFDDLLDVDEKDMPKLHQKANQNDLLLAMKGAGAAITAKLLSGVSDRRKKMLLEEFKLLGKVKRSDVDAAKGRIAETLRRLVESGEISLDEQWVE